MSSFTPSQGTAIAPRQPAAVPTPVAPNVQQHGFGDPAVKQWDFDLYTGRAGYTDVLQILTPPVMARIHYHDNLRGGVLCSSSYERQGGQDVQVTRALCCQALPDPQLRWAVLVLVHGTDKDGQVQFEPYRYELKLWRFGKDKYISLSQVHKQFPFERHDYTVHCTDQKMQKLTIGACPQALLLDPNFPAKDKATIQSWVKASAPKLPNELGARSYTDADLMTLLRTSNILPTGPVVTPQFTAADMPIARFGDVIGEVEQ